MKARKNVEELFNIGISENTAKGMLEINPNIKDMSNKEIMAKISLLKSIDCTDSEVLNIISSNPLYLNKTSEDIQELFKYLTKIGFSTLNILFDSNPDILNLEPFEIDSYIDKRLDKEENISDIIDDLENNSFIFNEM